jgi:hypothetical protein
MKIYRKESVLVGLFFLIAMAGSLVGAGLIEPVVTASDPVSAAAGNQGTLLAGIFLELICAVCVVGIAMFMAPILKSANPTLAAGYLVFRTVEAMFCALMTIAPASLLSLSRMPLIASTGAAAQTAILIRSFSAGLPLALFFCLGAYCLYTGLLRGHLLPKFIAVWGLIAVTLVLGLNIVIQYHPLEMTVSMILALPMILNEIFMGLWLIIKGFNKKAQSV